MKRKPARRSKQQEAQLLWHKIDIGLILAMPLAAAIATEIWHFNYFISTLLFFAVPSIYISFRKPKLIKKTLIFTLVFFAPFTIILDYMAYADLSWWVPNSAFRFMKNGIPIEDIPWAFLWVYFGVIFSWTMTATKSKLMRILGT